MANSSSRTEAAPCFLVTCEHGGNQVPPELAHWFVGHEEFLASHRGHDPGALLLAEELAKALDAPLVAATISRLVVDLNRSPGHPKLHGNPLKSAPRAEFQRIVESYYRPHRDRVEALARQRVEAGRHVIHLASHSFTPVLDGVARRADVGLLYDPARPGEAGLCRRWSSALKAHWPEWMTRRNYPYRGSSDGLCTWLRRILPAERYWGIEIEINQKHVFAGGATWERLRHAVIGSLLQVL